MSLEKRQASFCSLHIDCDTDASHIRDKECVLLPFSTMAHTLHYRVDAKYIQPQDFESLDIVTKDLDFKLCLDKNYSFELLISLF